MGERTRLLNHGHQFLLRTERFVSSIAFIGVTHSLFFFHFAVFSVEFIINNCKERKSNILLPFTHHCLQFVYFSVNAMRRNEVDKSGISREKNSCMTTHSTYSAEIEKRMLSASLLNSQRCCRKCTGVIHFPMKIMEEKQRKQSEKKHYGCHQKWFLRLTIFVIRRCYKVRFSLACGSRIEPFLLVIIKEEKTDAPRDTDMKWLLCSQTLQMRTYRIEKGTWNQRPSLHFSSVLFILLSSVF